MDIFFVEDKTCNLFKRNATEESDSFIIESPNGDSVHSIDIVASDKREYINSEAIIVSAYTKYNIVLRFDYSSHTMDLEKLIEHDEVEIPFSFNLRNEVRERFVLLNKEAVINYLADNIIGGNYWSGSVSLEFESVEQFTKEEIESKLYYSRADADLTDIFSDIFINYFDFFDELESLPEEFQELFQASVDDFFDQILAPSLDIFEDVFSGSVDSFAEILNDIIQEEFQDIFNNSVDAFLDGVIDNPKDSFEDIFNNQNDFIHELVTPELFDDVFDNASDSLSENIIGALSDIISDIYNDFTDSFFDSILDSEKDTFSDIFSGQNDEFLEVTLFEIIEDIFSNFVDSVLENIIEVAQDSSSESFNNFVDSLSGESIKGDIFPSNWSSVDFDPISGWRAANGATVSGSTNDAFIGSSSGLGFLDDIEKSRVRTRSQLNGIPINAGDQVQARVRVKGLSGTTQLLKLVIVNFDDTTGNTHCTEKLIQGGQDFELVTLDATMTVDGTVGIQFWRHDGSIQFRFDDVKLIKTFL